MKKYQCPCCGYYTYNVPANEDCGYICPVCFWENDPFITSDSSSQSQTHKTQRRKTCEKSQLSGGYGKRQMGSCTGKNKITWPIDNNG